MSEWNEEIETTDVEQPELKADWNAFVGCWRKIGAIAILFKRPQCLIQIKT